ncbi:MAG: UDP-Glycosyltransferase/glycogen phosphorylase [Frankiales bacterium]|nr:UDP-Glycosyltransferase/glycogen phosphorylase [Frankiales bacterium]
MRLSRVTRHGVLPRRVATISVHTSPLEQPGGGDAGGMNVYVLETAKRLAESGVEVEIFTRATSSDLPRSVEVEPGVTVRHVVAGPFEGLSKQDLPGQLCAFTAALLRAEAQHEPGWYDLVHSHYWLSGQVGWLARERWGVPLVHTAHTLAKAKNASLAEGDTPEPLARVVGAEQVVAEADRLIANTSAEADQLIGWYGAAPERVAIVPPGVDLEMFRLADASAARTRLGVPPDAIMLLFVGRLQPLKAPDVLIRAAAQLAAADPEVGRRLRLFIVGAPSGSGLADPGGLVRLAADLGLGGQVVFEPPVSRERLADYYQAADLTVVPSHSESFGLVALESQACGTPVLAAAVGGLPTAVLDGVTGRLVDGHRISDWAGALRELICEPGLRDRFGAAAREHAEQFSWRSTADGLLVAYRDCVVEAQQLQPTGSDLR